MAVSEARDTLECGPDDEIDTLGALGQSLERTGNEFAAQELERAAQLAAQEAERAALEAKRSAEEAERAVQEAERAVQEAERAVQEAERAVQEVERALQEEKIAARAAELAAHTLVKSHREAGGRRRGQDQRAARLKELGKHIEKYGALIVSGIPYLTARKTVLNDMHFDGVGNNLSDRTLRKWFPKPKKSALSLAEVS